MRDFNHAGELMLSAAGMVPLTDPNWDSVKYWQRVCFSTTCNKSKGEYLHFKEDCDAGDAKNSDSAPERVGG